MIILCFVIKVESYAVTETTSSSTKSSMKNSLDDFCTTTINNSLNCEYHLFFSCYVCYASMSDGVTWGFNSGWNNLFSVEKYIWIDIIV